MHQFCWVSVMFVYAVGSICLCAEFAFCVSICIICWVSIMFVCMQWDPFVFVLNLHFVIVCITFCWVSIVCMQWDPFVFVIFICLCVYITSAESALCLCVCMLCNGIHHFCWLSMMFVCFCACSGIPRPHPFCWLSVMFVCLCVYAVGSPISPVSALSPTIPPEPIAGRDYQAITYCEPAYWCSVSYYEMKNRVGEVFQVSQLQKWHRFNVSLIIQMLWTFFNLVMSIINTLLVLTLVDQHMLYWLQSLVVD